MIPSSAERLPALLAALTELEDPADVAVQAGALLELVRDLERQVSALRDEAVLALHDQAYSLQAIADVTGLSRGRVHQIVTRRE